MASTLHFPEKQDRLHPALAALLRELNDGGDKRGYQLSVANALWGQQGYPFREDFLKLNRDHYGAGLQHVDFKSATEAARQTINAWVEKQTRDRIKELLKTGVLDTDTRLVLTNAIYFKGDWVSPFDKQRTREEEFQITARDKVRVPLMNRKGDYKYLKGETFQALELPYSGQHLSMVIFLPSKVDGLPEFEKGLTADKLSDWIGNLRRQHDVLLTMPKFKMTSEFQFKEVLSKMGMRQAFDPTRADFTGISPTRELYISAVVHKAFVDVNEEGTEAAAATAVVVKTEAAAVTPVFRADHPFLFVIRDNRSGSILFLGRVSNPAR
jgi:serpin B